MTTDEQIDAIIRLMVTGKWKGGQSRDELAKEWDIHERTVGDRAISASAVVRRAGGPIEDWIVQKLAELDEVKTVAMSLEKPDCKAAAMAIKLQLEARGVFAKRPAEKPAEDAVAQMSPAEKVAAHKQAIAELEAEMGKANGGMH